MRNPVPTPLLSLWRAACIPSFVDSPSVSPHVYVLLDVANLGCSGVVAALSCLVRCAQIPRVRRNSNHSGSPVKAFCVRGLCRLPLQQPHRALAVHVLPVVESGASAHYQHALSLATPQEIRFRTRCRRVGLWRELLTNVPSGKNAADMNIAAFAALAWSAPHAAHCVVITDDLRLGVGLTQLYPPEFLSHVRNSLIDHDLPLLLQKQPWLL